MSLPETIAVKYTEEDAECLSIRPVVKQTFRLQELLDMILSVCGGKDVARIQKILRSGTIVFHFYRYRWEGFDSDAAELATALAAFPEANPARVFHVEDCSAVLLDTGSGIPSGWTRAEARQRRFLRRRSFWDELMAGAQAVPPAYLKYSYEHKADVFGVPLTPARCQRLLAAGEHLLPAGHRGPIASLSKAQRLILLCPRR
jgi:hypothetical protein